jgi:hypothetical protein
MSTHSITKEQIIQLSEDSLPTKIKLKQWFPELFFKTGWYRGIYNSASSTYDYFVYVKKEDDRMGKGFFSGNWGEWSLPSHLKERSNRVDADKVKDFLVHLAKNDGIIDADEDTTFWQYSELEDSMYDENHRIIYNRGSWVLIKEWNGEGWYKCEWRDGAKAFVYRKNENDNTGYGFYNGDWCSEIYFSQAIYINSCYIDELKPLFIEEAIRLGYTRENIVSLGGDSVFNTNVNDWTFYLNVMYTATEGNGGMIVYRKGIWANRIF